MLGSASTWQQCCSHAPQESASAFLFSLTGLVFSECALMRSHQSHDCFWVSRWHSSFRILSH